MIIMPIRIHMCQLFMNLVKQKEQTGQAKHVHYWFSLCLLAIHDHFFWRSRHGFEGGFACFIPAIVPMEDLPTRLPQGIGTWNVCVLRAGSCVSVFAGSCACVVPWQGQCRYTIGLNQHAFHKRSLVHKYTHTLTHTFTRNQARNLESWAPIGLFEVVIRMEHM